MADVPYGSEFRVNTTTAGNQDQGSVTPLANGRFVVTWHDNANIKAQVFNANGSKSGSEITVATTAKEAPVVAGLTDGGFVIAWTNRAEGVFAGDGVGTGSSIWARAFDAGGTANGNSFRVNDVNVDGDQLDPAIAPLTGNRFVITWTSEHEGAANPDIEGRLYGSTGAPSGSEFDVFNNSAVSNQSTVVGLSNGTYVVAWQYDSNIGAQIFDGQSLVGTWFTANTTTAGDQFAPAIASFNGGFEVIWTHTVSAGVHQIRGRSFTDAGVAGTPDGPIPQTSGSDQTEGAITYAGGTRYPIWRDTRSLDEDSSGSHIEGGGGFLINQTVKAGSQSAPSIAALKDGRYVVVWTDPGIDPAESDTSGNSVRARIFDPRTAAVTLNGSTIGDDFVGTRFDDTMNGQDGNDRLEGAGGNDSLGGGAGLDTIIGGDGEDKLFGNDADDSIFAGIGNDTVSGGAGADSFQFDVKPNKKTNLDHITDFEPGLDEIRLDASVFKKLKPGDLKAKAFFAKKNADEAKDGKDRIVYDTKSGELWWDKDGKGGAKAKLFAVLDGSPDDLSAQDFLVLP